MNIDAQASAPAGRKRGTAALRRTVVRTAAPAVLAVAAIAAVTGCTPHATAASRAHAAPTKRIIPPTQPTPVPTATVAASPAPPATPSQETPPPAPPFHSGLKAWVTIDGGAVYLVPGGKPVQFRVTVTNSSNHPYGNLLPLVSLGHCTCTANGLFPAGTLRERESTTNVWQVIPYDVEGFGTDYLNVTQPGGIQELPPGAVATFEYRVALSPATEAQVSNGAASIDVTLLPLPSHTPIGSSPAGSAPVYVQWGQPQA